MKLILIFEFSWLTEITNSIFLNIIVQIILERFNKQGIWASTAHVIIMDPPRVFIVLVQ